MARLTDGYERGRIGTRSFCDSLFRLGVALLHAAGRTSAIRRLNDSCCAAISRKSPGAGTSCRG